MPKYSYRCTACNHAFDIQQSFTDASLTVCPECSGALRKMFGAVGIAFKGSGFYANDHGSRAKPAASKNTESTASTSSDSSSSSTSDGGGSTSSDSASAPAPATATPAGASA